MLHTRCPYCDYRGTSSSLLIHHKRGRHKAELEMEMLEKERQSIKVPIEVQQQAAARGTQHAGSTYPSTRNANQLIAANIYNQMLYQLSYSSLSPCLVANSKCK